jgi:hypothetical protein
VIGAYLLVLGTLALIVSFSNHSQAHCALFYDFCIPFIENSGNPIPILIACVYAHPCHLCFLGLASYKEVCVKILNFLRIMF